MNAQQAWQATLGQLQVEMPKGTYDTWVAGLTLEAYEDGQFVIGAPNAYARDWVDGRLKSMVTRMLSGMVNRTVEVRFIVAELNAAQHQEEPASDLEDALTLESAMAEVARASTALGQLTVWEGNRMVLEIAKQFAKGLGKAYSPLFIHGKWGLGKTRTLKIIEQALTARGANVLCVTAEEFTNDFTRAIMTKKMQELRDKYRHLDALLIDDFHRLVGKEKTQEELVNVFNALLERDGLIVMASNKSPDDMVLDPALASRIVSGFVIPVGTPDFEARVRILKEEAESRGEKIPLPVLEQIAQTVDPDVRKLFAALNTVVAMKNLLGQEPTAGLVDNAVDSLASAEREKNPARVIEAVAKAFGITTEKLLSDRREYPLALARQVAMYLLREHEGKGLAEIGNLLGRDHTTIKHGVGRIEEELKAQNSPVTQKIRALEKHLYNPVLVKA